MALAYSSPADETCIRRNIDVLGRECLGSSSAAISKKKVSQHACMCLVSALDIQPVLLCSVIRRFVLCATRSGHHLSIVFIPHEVQFVNLFSLHVIYSSVVNGS